MAFLFKGQKKQPISKPFTEEDQEYQVVVNNTIIAETSTGLSANYEPHHYAEWKASAISDKIIKLNFKSILDPRELDEILGRNSRRRWKHSDNLIPAWACIGIDPLSWESTLQGVQVKCDNPPVDDKGKPQKYLSASGMETAPLFLDPGIDDYWLNVKNNSTTPIIITEGGKKAACGLSHGLTTISIPGVSSCRKLGRLHQNLSLFLSLGRTFYLCFDNDLLFKRSVQLGLIGLSAKLAKEGCNVMIIQIPEGDEKGMDDFISHHGIKKFQKLIDDAIPFEEWKNNLPEADDDDKPKSKIAQYYEMIGEAWGENLRYNTLKKQIEFNGMPLDAEYLKLMVGLQFPINISKDDCFTIVEFLAKRNAYSPITQYLDECEAKFPNIETDFLDSLAKQFFGSDDPLHATYFKNFLVASVARARVPGCWMDCALLLYGDQGIRKSTFWRTLYGDDFFSDDLGDGSDKDERMKMHRFWCLEWSEFETVYKRKDVNQLKAFLARRYESFRTPYDRLPKDYKRGCVFVGTTNDKEILNDPTGSRRFWIIDANGIIPTDLVESLRDKIWAAASKLFRQGYVYRLTESQEITRQTKNEEYEVIDPWAEIISDYTYNLDYTTIQQCFAKLEIPPIHQNTVSQRRISSILKKLGATAERVKLGGKWVRIWKFSQDQNSSNNGGSGGSNENSQSETQAQQELQVYPVENSTGGSNDFIHPLKTDPLEENNGITVSQADSNTFSDSDPLDPLDPSKVFEGENKNSQQTVAVNDLALPPPIALAENTRFGPVAVLLSVTKVYKNGRMDCEASFDFPNGSAKTEKFKIRRRQDAEELAREHITWWERGEMIDSKYTWSVRQMGDEEYVWIPGCKLVELQRPPQNMWFYFYTPEGQSIRVRDGSEFKLEQ